MDLDARFCFPISLGQKMQNVDGGRMLSSWWFLTKIYALQI